MDGMDLRTLRIRRALTQKELAEAAGVDPATIYRLERGAVDPSMKTRRQIAAALRVPVEELFVIHDAPDGIGGEPVRGHGVGPDQEPLAASAKS